MIVQYALEHGILDVQSIQRQIDMDRRNKILKAHKYHITFNNKKGRWYTRFDTENGVVQRNRKTREQLECLIVAFYENGNHFEDWVEQYTFAQAHDRWMEVQEEYDKNPNTLYKYEKDWRRYFMGTKFSKMNISDITPFDIEIFVINKIKELNMPRQAGVDLYGYINGVFYTAVIDRRIPKDENPCELVDKKKFKKYYNKTKKPQATRTMTLEEIDKLVARLNLDVTERPTCMSPYGVRLALLTGMRSGEICGLRWRNVTDEVIDVCESEKFNQRDKYYYISDTKTEKNRTIPITEGLRSFLNDMRELQKKYGIEDDFVISTASGKLHTRNLSDYMIKASKKLGFGVSKNIHTIRRTFNSYLRQGGTSAIVAGSIIGNTADVNNNHYTYDICDNETKLKLVDEVEDKMLANVKFA